jgi:CheY-like chemotaxis protein
LVLRQPTHEVKILLVEDHDDTRRVVSGFLERWGFDVQSAGSFRSGLDLLESQLFDVLVSDIGLGDGSGYALMTAAKRMNRHLKGVAISAYSANEDVILGKLAGFDRHLFKPFNPHELRSALDEVAGGC